MQVCNYNCIEGLQQQVNLCNCFAKAVNSWANLRTANSLSVPSSVSCPTAQANSFGTSGLLSYHNKTCVLFKGKRYSYVLPLQNKLFAEDRSFTLATYVQSGILLHRVLDALLGQVAP